MRTGDRRADGIPNSTKSPPEEFAARRLQLLCSRSVIVLLSIHRMQARTRGGEGPPFFSIVAPSTPPRGRHDGGGTRQPAAGATRYLQHPPLGKSRFAPESAGVRRGSRGGRGGRCPSPKPLRRAPIDLHLLSGNGLAATRRARRGYITSVKTRLAPRLVWCQAQNRYWCQPRLLWTPHGACHKRIPSGETPDIFSFLRDLPGARCIEQAPWAVDSTAVEIPPPPLMALDPALGSPGTVRGVFNGRRACDS